MRCRNLPTILSSLALTVTIVCVAGCRGRGLFAPKGPMNQRQATAVVHDPFPLNDIAPYDAASRPPSYQRPLPGPVRDRLIPDAFPSLGR